MDHLSYDSEIASASNGLLPVSEIEPLSYREQLMTETAYRRGYFQGYHAAHSDCDYGFSFKDMSNFLYGELRRWRGKRHNSKFEPPPEMQR